MMTPIGFMQGRLSPQVDGKIQSFPWSCWEQEFPLAQGLRIPLMEWTLDQERLYENPLLTETGQARIRWLCASHEISLPSLTGDCFMQSPFWKVTGEERTSLQKDFRSIIRACRAVNIQHIVVPLVDNGRLDSDEQEELIVDWLLGEQDFIQTSQVSIIFESDLGPQELARFIERLPARLFGVNYDIGNSAALGFHPTEEFECYGSRVLNVHVKDRVLGGTTVPLGTGNADFPTVFAALKKQAYGGNYIMQTARAADGDHLEALRKYRDMVIAWVTA